MSNSIARGDVRACADEQVVKGKQPLSVFERGFSEGDASNSRLASQQGAFLFNGAESRSFEESLRLLMKGVGACWYKRFRVPAVEFNIHDLSLFPDTEGLAGFVKQKLRLQFQ